MDAKFQKLKVLAKDAPKMPQLLGLKKFKVGNGLDI